MCHEPLPLSTQERDGSLLWEYVKAITKQFLNALANTQAATRVDVTVSRITLLWAETTPVWVLRELEFAIFSFNFCKCNYHFIWVIN